MYQGGIEKNIPIRRRFEVHSATVDWGHFPYSALACREGGPRGLTDPLHNGEDWGRLQMAVTENSTIGPWVCALPNPDPERQLTAVRIQATSEDPLIVCGLTAFHGDASPLRHERLSLYRFTLPEATAEDHKRWKVSVDLGEIARTISPNEFDATAWVESPQAGLESGLIPYTGRGTSMPRLRRAVPLPSLCTTFGTEKDTSSSSRQLFQVMNWKRVKEGLE